MSAPSVETPAIETAPVDRSVVLRVAFLATFLSAMDQTIIGTVLPRITVELAGQSLYAWVFTAYMLTTAATVPVAGKLGDLFGRRTILLAGVAVLACSSALGAVAWSMLALVLFRGVQGIGAGMISSNTFALLADLYPVEQRAKLIGLFSGAYALASLVGPILGGALTDQLGWRSTFWLNVPALAFVGWIFARKLPKIPRKEQAPQIDVLGALLLVLSVSAAVLAARGLRPDNALPVSPLVLGIVALVAFVLLVIVERKAPEPLVPLALFRNRYFALPVLLSFAAGPMLYAVGVYIPLYLQNARHLTATQAGITLAPMTLGVVFGSVVGGRAVSRAGFVRLLTVSGFLLATLSNEWLARMAESDSRAAIAAVATLLGLGIGLSIPVLSLVTQMTAGVQHLGVASASTQFARTLGGTIGIALLGELQALVLARSDLLTSVRAVFRVSEMICVLALLLSLGFGNLTLEKQKV